MFVLCPECHNHYDDSYQSSECAGVGRSAPSNVYSAHEIITKSPLETHIDATRDAARSAWPMRTLQ